MALLGGALLFAGCASVAVHLARLLWLAFVWRGRAATQLWSAWDSAKSWLAGGDLQDDVGREVTTRLHARRVEAIRWAMSLWSLFALVMNIGMISSMISNMVKGGAAMDPVPCALVTITYLCLQLPSFVHWEPSQRTVIAWYSLVMALVALQSLFPITLSSHLAAVPRMSQSTAIVVSSVLMQVRVAFIWLFVCFLFAAWGSDAQVAIALHLTWGVGAAFIALLMEGRAKGQLREQVQSEIMQERQSATAGLLRTLYDLVVELDSDLRVVGGAQDLAHFLSHHGRSLASDSFRELLLYDEDCELVSIRLRQCLNSGRSMAEVMHLHMRGGSGCVVRLEAFCIYYWCLGGRTHFLLGLREFGEERDLVSELRQGAEAVAAQCPDAAAQPQDVEVAVATSDRNLPILGCSNGFRHLIGGVPANFRFKKLIDEPQAFHRWLQKAVNDALEGCSESEEAGPSSYTLRLRPRFGTSYGRIRATCWLGSVGDAASSGSTPGPAPDVRLVLTDLRHEPASAAVCSGSSSSSSDGSIDDCGEQPECSGRAGRGMQHYFDQQHVGCLNEPTVIGLRCSL